MGRRLVRCTLNKYGTPLLSVDENGVYVRCKDCRSPKDGELKRGTYHLITWSTLMHYMAEAGCTAATSQFSLGDQDRATTKLDNDIKESPGEEVKANEEQTILPTQQ